MPGMLRSIMLACFGVTFLLFFLANTSTYAQASSHIGRYRFNETKSQDLKTSIELPPQLQPSTTSQQPNATPTPPPIQPSNASIGIVSMLYGEPEPHYIRAIQSFERYAQRHNYSDHVLRREITIGQLSGVWNKCAYLLHLLIQELAKPEEERLQWLFWVDADAIVANPSIPLSIFLPPSDFDQYDMIGSRDESGFNMGIFFLKVSSWSVEFMNKVLAYTQYNPAEDLFWKEQSAAMKLFKEGDTKRHVVYQPRMWWNAYQRTDIYEGDPGAVIIHFPNLGSGRGERMTTYLDVVEGAESELELPLEKTRYLADIEQFWNTLRYARETKQYVLQRIPDIGGSSRDFQEALAKLRDMWYDDTDLVHKLAKVCREVYAAYDKYETPEARAAREKLKEEHPGKETDLDNRFRYDIKWIDEEMAERKEGPLQFGHDGKR